MNSKLYRLKNGNIKLVVYFDNILYTKTFKDWERYAAWRTETFPNSKPEVTEGPRNIGRGLGNVIPFRRQSA